MTISSLLLLLQLALTLITTVNSTPNVPISLKQEAFKTANLAITLATTKIQELSTPPHAGTPGPLPNPQFSISSTTFMIPVVPVLKIYEVILTPIHYSQPIEVDDQKRIKVFDGNDKLNSSDITVSVDQMDGSLEFIGLNGIKIFPSLLPDRIIRGNIILEGFRKGLVSPRIITVTIKGMSNFICPKQYDQCILPKFPITNSITVK